MEKGRPEFATFVALALYTGQRTADVVAMTLTDIDRTDPALRLRCVAPYPVPGIPVDPLATVCELQVVARALVTCFRVLVAVRELAADVVDYDRVGGTGRWVLLTAGLP